MRDRAALDSATARVARSVRNGRSVEVGPIEAAEHGVLFGIFAEIVAKGEGYPQAPPLTQSAYRASFVDPVSIVVVARSEGEVLGGYYLKPNFPGRASHIANAGYLVASASRGNGVGRLLVEDSIARAPLLGFRAIQFNLVFASNPARALYRDLGFTEVGTIPDAVDGEDAVIYHRFVGGPNE